MKKFIDAAIKYAGSIFRYRGTVEIAAALIANAQSVSLSPSQREAIASSAEQLSELLWNRHEGNITEATQTFVTEGEEFATRNIA